MRTYLIDATNAVRRQDYAAGFPEMEDIRTREFIGRLDDNLRGSGSRVSIELFFDGPRRDLGIAPPSMALRFSGERPADDLILGTVRSLRAQGRGVIVATEDSMLRREVAEEGGRVIGFGELFRRLQDGKA